MLKCDNCNWDIGVRGGHITREITAFGSDDLYLFCSEKCAEEFMAKYVLPRMEVEDD